ncbi:MAG: hypothetical protein J1E35_05335 [Lachnospiraceae bacterium]|nr:hypothetical protein [Lachnospiraceae bacterium]
MKRNMIRCVLLIVTLSLFVACKQTEESPDEWEKLEHLSSEIPASLNSGKVLENLVAVGKDSLYYCNLEENMWGGDAGQYQVLVCKDPVYDITYYVNYGRDYYIYALRDGVSEFAAAVPAKDLFCRNGELYFIADSYGLYEFDGFAQGNILKYNPADGSIEIVVEAAATGMRVYPDGICYRCVGEPEEMAPGAEMYTTLTESFYFSFAERTATPFEMGKNEIGRWKNNYFVLEFEDIPETNPEVQELRALGYTDNFKYAVGVDLVDAAGNVNGRLKNIKNLPAPYVIIGDLLYYTEQRTEEGSERSRSVLMTYNLETGAQEDVAVLDSPITLMNDFLLHNDTLYFGKSLRVSLKDGSQCQPRFADESMEGRIDAFYTDGEAVFCLWSGKLWRMEENRTAAVAVVENIPGVPLEIGTYEYQLYPLGKEK